jgi:catechol 2,3-dioxygenase-like lactoylglutathione lyase family enzyme
MPDAPTTSRSSSLPEGPPVLTTLAHVSVPCRDLEEGRRFYGEVLGGALRVSEPTFAAFEIAGTSIGIGTEGCSWIGPGQEYPHIAFFAEPDQMLHMKRWLARCGVPTSNFWTRSGVEALMFFRDPSGNLIELFCRSGFEGARDLPQGPPRGHGTAIDIDALRYTTWQLPPR